MNKFMFIGSFTSLNYWFSQIFCTLPDSTAGVFSSIVRFFRVFRVRIGRLYFRGTSLAAGDPRCWQHKDASYLEKGGDTFLVIRCTLMASCWKSMFSSGNSQKSVPRLPPRCLILEKNFKKGHFCESNQKASLKYVRRSITFDHESEIHAARFPCWLLHQEWPRLGTAELLSFPAKRFADCAARVTIGDIPVDSEKVQYMFDVYSESSAGAAWGIFHVSAFFFVFIFFIMFSLFLCIFVSRCCPSVSTDCEIL